MVDVFYANAFDICTSREAIYINFKLQQGDVADVRVTVISPAGARALSELLKEKVEEHAQIDGSREWITNGEQTKQLDCNLVV